MALASRVGPVVRALRQSPVVIAERSMWSDRVVFAEMGLKEEAARAAYELAHDALREALPPHLSECLLLLDIPMETALTRIAERGRPEERGIDEGYLQQIADGHERLVGLCSNPSRELIRVDARSSSDVVIEEVCRIVSQQLADRMDR